MKYRVTTRGWIVFSIISILAVTLLLLFVTSFFDDNETGNMDNNSDTTTSDTTDDEVEDNTEVDQSTDDEVEDNIDVDQSTDDEVEDNIDVDQSTDAEVDLETDNTAEETSEEVLEDNTENSSKEENDTSENTTNNDITEQIIDMDKTTNILFNKNVFELTSISVDAIEEWLTIMNDNKDLQIVVEGHINGYPYYEDGKFGLALALSRAQVISDYFITQGISKDRITIINMGSKVQVDESKDLDKHYLNRRSVIYINKKP